jgi:hypothetical protein
MLTTKLEELILKGRAFFRTAVIGGTQKATININEDRFIIITDVTYFPGFYRRDNGIEGDDLNELTDFTSQFTIYGNRGYNNFVARTKFDYIPKTFQGRPIYAPSNHIRYDLYLLHTDQVGFSFCKGSDITALGFPAPTDNPGYVPPLDYGRVGDTGVINTSVTTTINTPTNRLINNTTRPGSTTNNAETFIIPFDADTQINAIEILNSFNYPILHVNYVEILGLPNNLGI